MSAKEGINLTDWEVWQGAASSTDSVGGGQGGQGGQGQDENAALKSYINREFHQCQQIVSYAVDSNKK